MLLSDHTEEDTRVGAFPWWIIDSSMHLYQQQSLLYNQQRLPVVRAGALSMAWGIKIEEKTRDLAEDNCWNPFKLVSSRWWSSSSIYGVKMLGFLKRQNLFEIHGKKRGQEKGLMETRTIEVARGVQPVTWHEGKSVLTPWGHMEMCSHRTSWGTPPNPQSWHLPLWFFWSNLTGVKWVWQSQ
jgi:hypothetical protein